MHNDYYKIVLILNNDVGKDILGLVLTRLYLHIHNTRPQHFFSPVLQPLFMLFQEQVNKVLKFIYIITQRLISRFYQQIVLYFY